ncbi:penicillin acylase family protein [Streptomyces sp. NPDC088755]|uniref:penicillin acylase family protein n=1 Tax=Streptomyces sp. NPDC088755 TaxID=3365888 RepID=UPI0037FBA26F
MNARHSDPPSAPCERRKPTHWRRPGVANTNRVSTMLACLFLLLSLAQPSRAHSVGPPAATIRYTEYGIPHIIASDYRSLGYGYGYASATDNVCTLAETYMTVSAQRSRYLGPDAAAAAGLTSARNSLHSDLHFQRINNSQVIERYAATAPRPVSDLVRGFAEGYNQYLRRNQIHDPACAGAAWVRPVDDRDVYRYINAVALLDGSGAQIDHLVGARPPSGRATHTGARATGEKLADAQRSRTTGNGSNAIAVGSRGTQGGGSVLLANPHFPWHGALRFWQSHLTIPGKMNVSGASLPGLPAVAIGHNSDVAWSHTVSTAATLGLFEVPTVPGSPTTYLVDGVRRKMTAQRVSVRVREADGSLSAVTRTLWSTVYGPVVDGLSGVPLPWGESAYVLRDANTNNLRLLETWLGLGQARSASGLRTALSSTLGIPWTNTVAVDRYGTALYTDTQVVPHVTDAHARRCNTSIGTELFARTGISVLDGSRSTCDWGSDADAREQGLLGPHRLPALFRRDYAANANNAPWLANPRVPLKNYPRVLGPPEAAPSMRAQQMMHTVRQRIDGTDGLPGRGFSSPAMRKVLFSDRSRVAEISRGELRTMCDAFPQGRAPSSSGPIDVTKGCSALALWRGDYRTDSRGSLLFSRFVAKLSSVPGGPWRVSFDRHHPLTTPHTLAIERPAVRIAFGDAARELATAGVPADAKLGDHQYVTRDGSGRIPIHGAPHDVGILNVITPAWGPGGNTEVLHGSSFIQVVQFGGSTGLRTHSLLAYSQSPDPTSAHHSDQTELYSAGRWVPERFTERQIRTSPALRTVHLTQPARR